MDRMHTAKNPFPFLLNNGAIVIDETCRCGHLRSDHLDRLGLAYGHGTCFLIACPCDRFTFGSMITRPGIATEKEA